MFEGKSRNVLKVGGAHVDVLRSFAIAQDDTTGWGKGFVIQNGTKCSEGSRLHKGDVSTWMSSDFSLRSTTRLHYRSG